MHGGSLESGWRAGVGQAPPAFDRKEKALTRRLRVAGTAGLTTTARAAGRRFYLILFSRPLPISTQSFNHTADKSQQHEQYDALSFCEAIVASVEQKKRAGGRRRLRVCGFFCPLPLSSDFKTRIPRAKKQETRA